MTVNEEVPYEGEYREENGSDCDRHQQEAPRHIVHNDEEWVDPGRRVKGPGEMHSHYRQADRKSRRPGVRSDRFQDQESDCRRDDMTATESASIMPIATPPPAAPASTATSPRPPTTGGNPQRNRHYANTMFRGGPPNGVDALSDLESTEILIDQCPDLSVSARRLRIRSLVGLPAECSKTGTIPLRVVPAGDHHGRNDALSNRVQVLAFAGAGCRQWSRSNIALSHLLGQGFAGLVGGRAFAARCGLGKRLENGRP